MSETPMLSWDSMMDKFVHGVAAPEDFLRADVDRVALIRRALKLPGSNNRAAAVALLQQMPSKEVQLLFPDLIQLARSVHGPIGAVRKIIFSLPRVWVLEQIDAQVEPILHNEEYDDYWMFLELYEKLDPVRAVKLARRACGSADSAIRELGLERLANFVASAAAETAEAETFRVALGSIWKGTASHKKRERLRDLAEDLYALTEGGPKVIQMTPSDATAWREEAQAIRDSVLLGQELDKTLAFLRRPHPPLQGPSDFVPCLQGMCWEQLGDDETALVFYQEAARLDHRHDAAIIDVLDKMQRFEEAVEVSERVIRSPDAGPEELYAATIPLRSLTRKRRPAEVNVILEKVITILKRAINLMDKGSPARDELRRRISIVMAACLQKSGRADEARQTIDEAIAKAPQDPDLLAYRGILKGMKKPAEAFADFKSAIRYGVASFWPFFYLSRHSLQEGVWEEALTLAKRARAFGAAPIALAEAYEVIAIAQSNLGFPLEEVVANFETAVALAPSNERIRQNREVARQKLNTSQAHADLQAELHQPESEPWQEMAEEQDRRPISVAAPLPELAVARE